MLPRNYLTYHCDYEVEIGKSRKEVIIKAGQVFKERYTFEYPVVFVEYVCIENIMKAMVAQTQDLLYINFEDGEQIVVNTPKYDQIWGLDFGILIKRDSDLMLQSYHSFYFEKVLVHFDLGSHVDIVRCGNQTFMFVICKEGISIRGYELELVHGTLHATNVVTIHVALPKFESIQFIISRDCQERYEYIILMDRNLSVYNRDGVCKRNFPVLGAVPVKTRRLFQDVLLLHYDGFLKLWNGNQSLIDCDLTYFGTSTSKRKLDVTSQMGMRKKRISRRLHKSINADSHDSNIYASNIQSISSLVTINSAEFTISDSSNNNYRTRFDKLRDSFLLASCFSILQYILEETDYSEFIHYYHDSMRDEKISFITLEPSPLNYFYVVLLATVMDTSSSEFNTIEFADWNWLSRLSLVGANRSVLGHLRKEPFCGDNDSEIIRNSKILLRKGVMHLYNYKWSILAAMHLLRQDIRLYTFLKSDFENLSEILPLFEKYSREGTDSDIYPQNQLDEKIYRELFHATEGFDLRKLVYRHNTYGEIPTIHKFLELLGPKDLSLLKCCRRLITVSNLYCELLCSRKAPSIEENDLKILIIGNLPLWISLPLQQAMHGRTGSQRFWSKPRIKVATFHQSQFESIPQLDVQEIIQFRTEILSLRFRKDSRLTEARNILSVCKSPVLVAKVTAAMSVEEISVAQQSALSNWTQSSFPLRIGLGMFTFESKVAIATEKYPVPDLNLSAKLPPLNCIISLAIPTSSNLLDWPHFHTGAAAALEIRSDCLDIDSSWIVFNHSSTIANGISSDAKHGGFIFGLGLTKHLRKLDAADSLRNYFLPQHEVLTVGHLLGLSVAYLGERNKVVTSILSVHIPSLLPMNAMELSSGYILKSGAVVGYGLVNLQSPTKYSYNRIFSELRNITHRESSIENAANDLYAVSCGFSIVFHTKQGFMGLSSIADGKYLSSTLVEHLGSIISSAQTVSAKIGSCIALGLLAINSDNERAIKILMLPYSNFLLDHYTIELLLVMTISRYIIQTQPLILDLNWIYDQIPHSVLKVVMQDKTKRCTSSDNVYLTYYTIIAGLGFAIGLNNAGSFHKPALCVLQQILDQIVDSLNRKHVFVSFSTSIYQTALKTCLNAVCSGMAMVMAGSGNLSVLQSIKSAYGTIKEPDYGTNMALGMCVGLLFLGSGLTTVGNSRLAAASLYCSFFPIFPLNSTDNRYHLQALRHLWALAVERRCAVTVDSKSGAVVSVPVEVVLRGKENGAHRLLKAFTPFLLPQYCEIKEIRVTGPRYIPFSLRMQDLKLLMNSSGFREIPVNLKQCFNTYEKVNRIK